MMQLRQYGRRCRFIYPPVKIECPNCLTNTSGLSAGVYRPGGPQPFQNTTCPVCAGKGLFDQSQEEEDIMIVLFDVKQWFEPAKVATLPDNSAMIIGDRKRTWDRVVKSHRMILNTDVYTEGTPYRLSGEPFPVGLFNADDRSGSRWFYACVVREGGG